MSQIKIKQIEGLQAILDALTSSVTSGSLKSVFTQNNHGFTPGVAVSYNDLTATWILADSSSEDKLGRIVVESCPTTNTFVGVQAGAVIVSTWNLTPGVFYVVDNSGTGALVPFTTNDAYPFSNPIMQAISPTIAHVLPWRPSVGGAPLDVPIETVQSQKSLATSGNYQSTGIVLEYDPFDHGAVNVIINGIGAHESYGNRTGEVYFSNDGGTTAKSQDNIKAGDTLYYNGIIGGYDLGSDDVVDIVYQRSSLA